MNYRDLNDYELISYVKEHNEEANQIMYEKYKPLVTSIAAKMHRYCKNNGLEINDLIQEGFLGLNLSLVTFSEQKNTSFYTYTTTCIERKMISAIITANRLKHKILNESLSFEIYNNENDDFQDFQALLGDNTNNPETIILNDESQTSIISKVRDKLTDFEAQVFDLKVSGFNYLEIAEILDRDSKAIDNAIQRIRSKARKELKGD